jgi:alkanesulfonate monooxygenase SsuD/methylene tetrahydromethanopterin reductase-like flavin-dependent oxidoreductase (luciferase family)
MSIRFGATICQVLPFELLRDDFVFAESVGLDNAWVIDQFGIDGEPDIPLLEAWTTLGGLARETTRIRIGAMVTNVSTRNPGVLAKSILTVDQLSSGRVDAVLGSGYYATEHAALGIEFPDGAARSERLREAVAILDSALRGETVSHQGAHFRLSDATFRPAPTPALGGSPGTEVAPGRGSLCGRGGLAGRGGPADGDVTSRVP